MKRSVMSASFLFFSSRSFTNFLEGPIPGSKAFFKIVRKKLRESALPVPRCGTARKRHALIGETYSGFVCLFGVIISSITYGLISISCANRRIRSVHTCLMTIPPRLWPMKIKGLSGSCHQTSSASTYTLESDLYFSLDLQTMDEVGDRSVETVDGTIDPDIGVIAIGHYSWADPLSLALKKGWKLITKPTSLLDAFPAVLCARK